MVKMSRKISDPDRQKENLRMIVIRAGRPAGERWTGVTRAGRFWWRRRAARVACPSSGAAAGEEQRTYGESTGDVVLERGC